MPPGPRLSPLVQGLWLTIRPAEFFKWIGAKYGRVAHIRLAGLGDVVCVTEPDLIKQIYLDHDHAFAGEASRVMEPVLGPRSVLLLDGSEHLRQRKLLLPPFHGEALRGYEQTMGDIARREIARWPAGRVFSIRPHMQAITLEVILRVIFGIDDQRRRDEYSAAIDRLMAVANLLGLNVGADGEMGRLSPRRLIARRRQAVDDLIYEDIARRRADPRPGADDILSLLLAARDEDGQAMTDGELRDELVTTVFAGHETTATALAWAVDQLVWNPDVLARAVRAAHEDDDVYIDALASETLRLRPVVWSTGRIVQETIELGEWRIPPGVRLWSPLTNLAFDPAIYRDPERFDPQRFVDEAPPSYAWVPFGGGIRRCIGASFAQLEMRVVLKEMLLAGHLQRTGRAPARQRMRAVTLAPARGTRVRFAAGE